MIIDKNDFKNWLTNNEKNLKEISINSIISDSLYIQRVNLDITLEDLLSKKKSINDYKNLIKQQLIKEGKTVGSRPVSYASSMKYLLNYLNSNINDSLSIEKILKAASRFHNRTSESKETRYRSW